MSDVVKNLELVLATKYAIYLKTQNYHWNVKGPMFHSLHAMFMEQYTDLALTIDEVAERIKALGSYAPGSFSKYSELSLVEEENGEPKAEQMIKNLVDDNNELIKLMKEGIRVAEKADDDFTMDLLTTRVGAHRKAVWMLESQLG